MMTARLQSNIECASSGGFSGGGQGLGFGVGAPGDTMITSAYNLSLRTSTAPPPGWERSAPTLSWPNKTLFSSFSIKLTGWFQPHLYPPLQNAFTQEHYVICRRPVSRKQPLQSLLIREEEPDPSGASRFSMGRINKNPGDKTSGL